MQHNLRVQLVLDHGQVLRLVGSAAVRVLEAVVVVLTLRVRFMLGQWAEILLQDQVCR